jgi:hypothetical protein
VKIYVAFLCISLYSCSDQAKTVQKDKANIVFDGVWAVSDSSNAMFSIQGDTIIDFEHGDRMHFRVSDDTMIIDYGGYFGNHEILKHTSDSLILRNEDGSVIRLYHRATPKRTH